VKRIVVWGTDDVEAFRFTDSSGATPRPPGALPPGCRLIPGVGTIR